MSSTVLVILKAVLAFAAKLMDYISRKQLMDAGKAEQQKVNLKEAKDAINKAIAVRRRARDKYESDGMPDDYEHWRD
mgnify:CR=1 FL=1